MNRRKFIYTSALGCFGAIAGVSLSKINPLQAETVPPLTIRWLGHTSFLITSSKLKLLINPFKPIGCTAGYPAPAPTVDIVLLSSQLFDEGFVEKIPSNPTVLWRSGKYDVMNTSFEGLDLDHSNTERYRGRRFPPNVGWSWQQAGINLVHLGGAGAPLSEDDKTLIGGRPDVLMIPVGGGDNPPKGYKPEQAIAAIQLLNPRLVIPMHYKTAAADASCDLNPVQSFLNLVNQSKVKVTMVDSNQLALSSNMLPQGNPEIRVLSDRALKK